MPFYSMKNWKNRDVEFPGRRTLTDVLTSTSKMVDVARSVGTVTEAGDAFDASTMNDLEGRIGSAFSLVDGAKFNKPVNSPSEGQVVKYSSGSVVWANESGGGGGGDIIPFLPLCTVNGSIANFPDGANNIPVEACIANIIPAQSGSGTPTPDNIRTISGLTETNILKQGANLIKTKYAGRTSNGVTYTVNVNGSILCENTATANSFSTASISDNTYRCFVRAGTYTLSGGLNANIALYLGGQYIDGTNIPGYSSTASEGTAKTFTLTQDAWIYPIVKVNSGTATNVTIYPMLVYGSTGAAFEEYKEESFEIAFGDTIYCGTLNATTGVLTATHAFLTKAVADMNNSEDFPGWTASGAKAIIGPGVNTAIYTPTGYFSFGTTIAVNTNGANDLIYLPKSAYNNMTQSQWMTSYPDLICQMVIPLATPLIIPLTSTAINTYYGVNNFSADTGDISVSYRADIQLYIDKKIAEI